MEKRYQVGVQYVTLTLMNFVEVAKRGKNFLEILEGNCRVLYASIESLFEMRIDLGSFHGLTHVASGSEICERKTLAVCRNFLFEKI